MPQQPQPRNWMIEGNPFVVDDDDELDSALMEARIILTRLGGAVTVAAVREQVAPEHWQTTGFAFQWHSFVPGKRKDPEPVTEAEPVADNA